MDDTAYPDTVLNDLMGSELVSGATWQGLAERLAPVSGAPAFFDASEMTTLEAVLSILLPQIPDCPTPHDVAVQIDSRLAKGEGNGWRYDILPADGTAYKRFLNTLGGLDAAAVGTHIQTIAQSSVPGDADRRMLEEVLSEAMEIFYAHPKSQESIGYVGYADRRGFHKLGLNEREEWQPVRGTPFVLPTVESLPPIAPILQTPPAIRQTARFSTKDTVDAVIIGTGAGGAPILAKLAHAGLKVVALEAGKFWNPQQDFATDEHAQDKLFWKDERLSAGESPLAFGNNNSGIGVGGSTLHFTAYTPRPHAADFRLYTDFGVGHDWPIGYADLEPYLTQAERFLGVSGMDNYPWSDERTGNYPLPPLPLNAPAQLMQRGCDALGIPAVPAPNAALSAPYYQEGIGWRPACTNRGHCQAGCNVGAKASMDVTYIAHALHHGAEVRSECFVTDIEHDAGGSVTGVVYTRADGTTERQPCRALFLCAGAVESPRLLLLNNLGNESGQVGRNFMAHPGLQIWAQFDEMIYPTKGIPGGLISEETHRPNQSAVLRERFGDADFAGGYLLQSIGVMPVTYASQFARGTLRHGGDLKTHMDGFQNIAGINILGDGLPYAHNFLELSDEKDARGLPKPRIHYTEGEHEKRMMRHADRVMRAIFQEAGAAREVWAFERSAHTLGTCRMGNDPRNSVVNGDARVWSSPNLYVCDNSVFASALSVNPALTQIALSLRVADRFLQARR